jgi:hypothetical protein
MINQTYKKFVFYELNYGDDDYSILKDISYNGDFLFFNQKLKNHADAMNYLFDVSVKNDIDILFNTNIDDFYDVNRIHIQMSKIEDGYDIVSSNFSYIDELDREFKHLKFHNLIIKNELDNNHNIIAHPSVCYSRKFFSNERYSSSDIPKEDLNLWKKTIGDYKFYICPEDLLKYRIHDSQVTNKDGSRNIDIDKSNVIKPITYSNNNINKCSCGEIKNRVKYNFCQKCNKIY